MEKVQKYLNDNFIYIDDDDIETGGRVLYDKDRVGHGEFFKPRPTNGVLGAWTIYEGTRRERGEEIIEDRPKVMANGNPTFCGISQEDMENRVYMDGRFGCRINNKLIQFRHYYDVPDNIPKYGYLRTYEHLQEMRRMDPSKYGSPEPDKFGFVDGCTEDDVIRYIEVHLKYINENIRNIKK